MTDNLMLRWSIPLLAITAFFAFLMLQANEWSSWQTATCMPDNCFCEALHGDTIRQPANTWSSLAFTIVGVLVGLYCITPQSSGRLLQHTPIYSIIFSLSTIMIGLGSAFYHASLTFWGQFLDVGSMYLLGSFILVYAWRRLHTLSDRTTLAIYIFINALLLALLYFVPETRRSLFGILLVVALGFETFYAARHNPTIQRGWFNFGLLLFALSYGVWILDNQRIWCSPMSWLQGHALWHVGGALATGMLYLYYNSERYKPTLES